MIDTKNLSPKQISAINALAIAFIVSIFNLFFVKIWWVSVTTFFTLFFIVYLLTHFFIQHFIFRKIKLIYKFIYQTKATKREEFYFKEILPQKSIEAVSEDVENWAKQRRAEIDLLQKNEAYRKEFLQNLSHEFKTPVFAIQGYVDTLLSGAIDNSDVNRKFLEKAARNVDRLVNLIADLDEISKLESGEIKLYKSNFIIQELIKEVFDSLSIKSTAKNIQCSIKKGCEYPVTVFADKEKTRQILINLIDNAIKYGNQNGHIEASVYNTDGSNILVEISDDGVGISEEHLPRIFERFYRTDYGRSRNIGGTGLGLAICKHIVEADGHTIHVRSKQDIGTTFGFTLSIGQ